MSDLPVPPSDAAAPARAGAAVPAPRPRVLSGMRPTGAMHIGHYHGALKNWVRLQDQYECFYFAADWHALTSDYADPRAVVDNTLEMVADWIAAGLDPERSVLFIQSMVPEHAELHLLLSMLTPLGCAQAEVICFIYAPEFFLDIRRADFTSKK